MKGDKNFSKLWACPRPRQLIILFTVNLSFWQGGMHCIFIVFQLQIDLWQKK